jgi:hypothetical protein
MPTSYAISSKFYNAYLSWVNLSLLAIYTTTITVNLYSNICHRAKPMRHAVQKPVHFPAKITFGVSYGPPRG